MSKAVIWAIIGAAIVFLLCGFYNVTFSIQYWSPEGRFMCIMGMLGAGAFGALIGSDGLGPF